MSYHNYTANTDSIIKSILVEFSRDPDRYVGCSFAEVMHIHRKGLIYPRDNTSLKELSYIDGDFVYAIKNTLGKRLLCKLFLSGIEINRFVVEADTIHTIFYDTPLYLICTRHQNVSLRIFDKENGDEIHSLMTVYFGFIFDESVKMNISFNVYINKIDNRFIIYRDGIGSIVDNISDDMVRNNHGFM